MLMELLNAKSKLFDVTRKCPVCLEAKKMVLYYNCKHGICESCHNSMIKCNVINLCPYCRAKPKQAFDQNVGDQITQLLIAVFDQGLLQHDQMRYIFRAVDNHMQHR